MIRNVSNRSKISTNQSMPNSPTLKLKKKSSLDNKNKLQNKSYIEKAFYFIQNGCYQQEGFLNIDGHYGDYKMKMFRNKNKLKHINDPKSIFQKKNFQDALFSYAKSGLKQTTITSDNIKLPTLMQKQQKQALQILNQKPILKAQRRMPNRRQVSIQSPLLKQILLQANTQKGQSQQSLSLHTQISAILSRPNSFYLPSQKIQNQEQQQNQAKILRKGVEQELREKDGHLFYRSIPKYMAEKWFKNLDNSTQNGNYVPPYIQQKILPKKIVPVKPKKTHLFRSLEYNFPNQFKLKQHNRHLNV